MDKKIRNKIKYFVWTEGVLISILLVIFVFFLIFRITPFENISRWAALFIGISMGFIFILFIVLMSIKFKQFDFKK